MKKSVIAAALLFSSSLFASSEMDSAIKEHTIQNYQKSYDMFTELFKKDTGNPEINFYLGLNAIELKKYEEALAAFERALIIDPKNIRTRLEYAKTLYLMRMFDLSKEELEKIKKESIPKEVSDNIDKYLAEIEASREKHLLIGVVQLGMLYDNNLNNTVDNDKIYIPSVGTSLSQDTNKKHDVSHSELIFVGHNYDFGEKDGYLLKSQAVVYNQGYRDSKDKNIVFTQLASGPAYIRDEHSVQLLANYDRVMFGGENLFSVIGVSPDYTYAFNKNLNAGGGFKMQKKEHSAEENKDKNSFGYEAFVKTAYKLTPEDSVALNYSFAKEDKLTGIRTDVDTFAKNYKVAYAHDVTKELKSTLSYNTKMTEYRQSDANFHKKRVDEYHNVGLNLTYSINPLTQLSFVYNRILSHSNIELYQYNKDTIGLSFTKIFMKGF